MPKDTHPKIVSLRRDLFRLWCLRHYAERWRATGARDAIRYVVRELRRLEREQAGQVAA